MRAVLLSVVVAACLCSLVVGPVAARPEPVQCYTAINGGTTCSVRAAGQCVIAELPLPGGVPDVRTCRA